MPHWVNESMPLVALALAAALIGVALWLIDRGQARSFRLAASSMDALRIAESDIATQAREGLRVHEEVVRSLSMLKGLHPHHADPKTFTPSTIARKDAEHVERIVDEEARAAEGAEGREIERQRREWERLQLEDEAEEQAKAGIAYRAAVEAEARAKP